MTTLALMALVLGNWHDSPTVGQVVFWTDWALKVALALRIIMSRRSVPVTLAWLLVLFFPVPFVGVFLYAIVGEVRLGTRRLAKYRQLTEGFSARAGFLWRARNQHWNEEAAQYKHISDVAFIVGGMPPLRGNAVRLMSGAKPFIDSLIADIDEAKSRVHLLFYIWIKEAAGARVVEALERACSRGVECRVLVDAVGSHAMLRSDLPDRMRKAGVKFVEALPVSPLRMLFARLDLRNHRKIAVIDGWTAYTGSQNIAETTFKRRSRKRKGPYIDAMARVVGPAAQALDVVFLRDWEVESEEKLGEKLEDLLIMRPVPETGSIVQVAPSGPDEGAQPMREAVLTTLFAAKRELIMTTPYFVPDEASKEALIAAALRGVRVTIVVPDEHDSRFVAAAARAHFLDLLEAGVRIMHHTKGLLHSKTVTIDGAVGVIGSANFDTRSFALNFEVTLFIYDAEVAGLLRELQLNYLKDSEEVLLEDWMRRPVWQKGVDNAARLLGPIL